MDSFKMQHGMPFDARLGVIARRSSLSRGEALALWVALLDHASRAARRGSVKDIDPEEIAVALEFDAAAVDAALKSFHEKNMITAEGLIADWEKQQNLSTRRTRKHREKMAVQKTPPLSDDSARRARLEQQRRESLKKRGHPFPEP